MTGNLWRFVIVCLCVSSVTATQTPDVPPQPTAIEGAVTHVYKSIAGADLRLHVFAPSRQATERTSAILFFFGGAWTNGSVEQFVPQSQYLAQRGMVAIIADYRVFGHHRTSALESMADARSAIRWVRSHAKELNVDPTRIAAGGGSAGGHIALSAGVFKAFDETR
jgi:acetyl esterase/lipase